MRFVKMHGIGNDYIYVDCFTQPAPADPVALSRAVSDRHFGIGSDGLILVCRSDKADGRMRMFNADGSESEMCGNGIRCVAKFMHDNELCTKNPLTIETGRGVLTLRMKLNKGKVDRVTVDMGEPILEPERMPTTLPGPRVVDQPLPLHGMGVETWGNLCGLDPRMTCVSMGNPHLVLFCEKVDKVPLETIGPLLEHASCFPRRINVHFVQVQSMDEAIMRTWERGSGVTLACGTGACAVNVAGVLTGRTGRQLLLHLPGGDLRLNWSESDHHVHMTGPAAEVFRGDWPD
jgi:diaminopimelate epimerase